MENKKDRVIITVVGKDTVGIIAKVCTYLANNRINVQDISQTIVQDFFNMMMVADISQAFKHFELCASELAQIGDEIGVVIKCQKEEIFDKMHRI
jgi:ACT domain-containing protein